MVRIRSLAVSSAATALGNTLAGFEEINRLQLKAPS